MSHQISTLYYSAQQELVWDNPWVGLKMQKKNYYSRAVTLIL
jgi:hypothetical protein